MTTFPFSKFFWRDYESDTLLKLCSLAAQGMWMRLLCIAAQSSEYGYVIMAGRNPTALDIAKTTGATESEVAELIAELERNHIFSRDRRGVIYSRRMINESKSRETSSKGGKKGGPVSHSRKTGIHVTRGNAASTPASGSASLESRVQSPEARQDGPRESETDRVIRIGRIIGHDPTMNTFDGPRWVRQIQAFIGENIDVELDLIPAIHQALSQGVVPRDLDTLNWFGKRAREKRDARLFAANVAAPPPADTTAVTPEAWGQAFRRFLAVGAWLSAMGPSPLEPGCAAPAPMLEQARQRWEAQGNHPTSGWATLGSNLLDDWQPGYSNFPEPRPFHTTAKVFSMPPKVNA